MPRLRTQVLTLLQDIGDRSGCHQMVERSFRLRGYTFPVCARCTGVFFGQIVAVLLLIIGIVCPWYITAGLLGIMGLDWMLQRIGLKESTNIRRLVTGFFGGFGLFSLYIFLIMLLFELLKTLFGF